MKRAHQLFLGSPPPIRPMDDDEYLPLDSVSFTPQARTTLARQVRVPGRWHGGALFGELVAGSLTVQLVAPLAPPGWTIPVLMPYLPYLLGWSDCIAVQSGASVDWYGNWVAAPDGRLPDPRADLTWLTRGGRLGLFDEQHGLVVLGVDEGRLLGRAYRWENAQPVEVGCRMKLDAPDL